MGDAALKKRVKEIIDLASGLRTLRIMEVCGTHTVSLFRSGVKSLLPRNLRLISGPGCPVCVTPQGHIDAAIELARRPGITVCTYGDMMRVPGSRGSLEQCRAEGASVVVCYSIRDALRRARSHPRESIVFLAVGFETTAPATALAVLEAERDGLKNFTILNGHKRVMPAILHLLAGGEVPIDGFLLPGHVSVIIGSDAYRPLVDDHRKACAVAGFEPGQLLEGILRLVRQLRAKSPSLENAYPAAVRPEGNRHALACMDRVFRFADSAWRAMGTIPGSGLELAGSLEAFDARLRHDLEFGEDRDPVGCRCGEVIQGRIEPGECPLFGEACTLMHPVGPCMVSSEGACAAWYRYGGVDERKKG